MLNQPQSIPAQRNLIKMNMIEASEINEALRANRIQREKSAAKDEKTTWWDALEISMVLAACIFAAILIGIMMFLTRDNMHNLPIDQDIEVSYNSTIAEVVRIPPSWDMHRFYLTDDGRVIRSFDGSNCRLNLPKIVSMGRNPRDGLGLHLVTDDKTLIVIDGSEINSAIKIYYSQIRRVQVATLAYPCQVIRIGNSMDVEAY